MHSIIELKSPYKDLYRSAKNHLKEQTMFEVEALQKMKNYLTEDTPIVAVLTDIFSLNIIIKIGIDFYISEAVYGSELYLYSLFFLLLDFEKIQICFQI